MTTERETLNYPAIIERIRFALPDLSISQMARRMSFPATSITGYFRMENKPSLEFIHRLTAVFGIPVEWLLTGKGQYTPKKFVIEGLSEKAIPIGVRPRSSAIETPPVPPSPSPYAIVNPRPEGEPPFEISRIVEPGQVIIPREDYEQLSPTERKLYVPIVGVAACGQAVEDVREQGPGIADEYAGLGEAPADPAAIAVRLAGESMEPTYRDGDLVLVAPNRQARETEPAVIVFADGTAMFKYWRQDQRSLSINLRALNPAWPAREIDAVRIRRILGLLTHMPLMVVHKPGG